MAQREKDFASKLALKAPEWELLGDYINARTRVLVKHKPCGTVCYKTPFIILQKPFSCRACNSKRITMTNQDFLNRIANKLDRYTVLSEYINQHTKIKIKHLVCGNVFETTPVSFERGDEGCPFCVSKVISKRRTFTHDQFVSSLGDRAGEYEFLTEYSGAKKPITVRHKCGKEWTTTPDNLLRGCICKRCKYSTGEGELYSFLNDLLPCEVIQGDRTILPDRYELDIYIPSMKIAIEYDGLAYHTVEHFIEDNKRNWSYGRAASFHSWKTSECKKRGIRLIHIFEDEWTEHKDIVKDKLSAILKAKNMERLFARKLQIREIPGDIAKKFLDENHIQGRTVTPVAIGLFDGERLVAVQVFSHPRAGSGLSTGDKGTWELVRYATLLGTVIVGGFSRCLKYFEQTYSPSCVVSFADKRWSDPFSNVYNTSGFELAQDNKPNYWYVKGGQRFHRFNFRKSQLAKKFPAVYSPDKTERQMMREAGYRRIYDCGLLKYVKRY